jgi:hypothetical protein
MEWLVYCWHQSVIRICSVPPALSRESRPEAMQPSSVGLGQSSFQRGTCVENGSLSSV